MCGLNCDLELTPEPWFDLYVHSGRGFRSIIPPKKLLHNTSPYACKRIAEACDRSYELDPREIAKSLHCEMIQNSMLQKDYEKQAKVIEALRKQGQALLSLAPQLQQLKSDQDEQTLLTLG